jgi:tetrapyrrole methylase family protein / MazG family protein
VRQRVYVAHAIEAGQALGIQLRTMSERFTKLIELMATLRAVNGCPWDRKQTHDSLKPYLLEETYEVLETIDQHDHLKLREELGDVLLQVIFHSQIAAEAGTFTVDDVLDTLADKLVRRHPHVFGTESGAAPLANGEQVLHQWEQIKRAEREAAGGTQSALDGVPKTLPALLRAYQTQARAARVGFDWPHNAAGLEQIFGKVAEEVGELQEALAKTPTETESAPNQSDRNAAIESELGDILFSLVNLARFVKVNPEEALRGSTNRFIDRFHLVEAQAAENGTPLTDMTLAEMDLLWEEAKQRLARPVETEPEQARTSPQKDIPL